MTVAAALAPQAVTVLRAFAAGVEVRDIPSRTGIDRDTARTVVERETGHDRGYAAELVRQHDSADSEPATAATSPAAVEAAGSVLQEEDPADLLEEDEPRVVALCGPREAVQSLAYALALDGVVVLAPMLGDAGGEELSAAQRDVLDTVQLHRIDLAGEVIVVNSVAALDDTPRKQVVYAQMVGRPVTYLHESAVPALPAGPVPGEPSEGAAHPATDGPGRHDAPLLSFGSHLCESHQHTSPTAGVCCDRPMIPVSGRLYRKTS